MVADVNALIRAGQQALKAGDKAAAREQLEQAVEVDAYNETAWLWLSAVVEGKEEQQTCLQNVLIINPENERAKMGLRSMGVDPDTVLAAEEEADEFDELDDDFGFEEDPYAVETSSASSQYGDAPEQEDQYDEWVDGLNLNTDGGANTTMPVAPSFDEDDYFDDDDLFGDDGAGASNLFDVDEFDDDYAEEDYDDNFEDFGDSTYEDTSAGAEDVYDEEFEEGYDDFDLDEDFLDEDALDMFEGVVDEGIHDFDDHDTFGDFDLDAHFEDENADPKDDPNYYWDMIPKEISAAERLPGEPKPAPTALMAVVGILVILNIGAIVFAVSQVGAV
ncbi:MAG: hypothetical protein ACPG7F_07520 [Aggregatilineales bacterium]